MRRMPRLGPLLAFAIAASLGWGQQAGALEQSAIREFDARDVVAGGSQAAAQLAQARALVERRMSAIQSFLAAETAADAGTRITPGRYGLPKMYLREGKPLTGPSALPPEEIARGFLRSHAAVFPFSAREVDDLRPVVEDVTPRAAFLVFNQTLDGIDVFEGQIKFTLSKAGEIAQVASGEIAPGLNLSTVPRLTPEEAVRAAYAAIGASPPAALVRVADPNGRTTFLNPRGARYNPIASELSIFPLTASSARLAYRIYLDFDSERSYEILIDGQDGSLLYRHNLYVYDAQGRVWPQSPMTGSRQLVTFPTAAAAGAAPDPWLASGAPVTTGNNVDAYLDANGDDQPDATTGTGFLNGRAYSATQLFDFPFGDGTLGLDPRNYQAAAVTNLFYLINTAHDYYYSLGFTEAAGNFQTDNYGRGGAGNDAVLAEAQQGAMTNNAAFAPTPEGTAPHIRMGLFTRNTTSQTDDLDSDYDGTVVIHEYGHGVSTRLVGGSISGSCLSSINAQSGAMGEGWSDYFAVSFYNNPVVGAYVTQNPVSGARRYSYEGYPYTYEDLGNPNYEVHNDGEIWAAALWDLRKALGQAVTDKLVVDGLKSTPCNPTMTNGRDAILSADLAANGGANRAAIWQVFAKHGMGYSANGGVDDILGDGIRYDAAYDQPPDLQSLKNPVVTSDPLATIPGLGDAYPYVVTATNPNGGVLNFAIGAGPAGMTIDPASGKVTWTVGFTQQRVKIVVTDGKGGKVVHGYWLPVNTQLNLGVPVTIAGEAGSVGTAFVTIPSSVPVLLVTVRNTPSAMILNLGGYGQGAEYGGSQPTAYVVDAAAWTWNIIVFGEADAYSGGTLTVSAPTPVSLDPNATLTGLSGGAGSDAFYRVSVPAGAPALTVSTSGGTGNSDFDLRMADPPIGYPYAVGYMTGDNTESITISAPPAGDWYIHLHGTAAYSGVRLAVATGAVTGNPVAIATPSTLPPGATGVVYMLGLVATPGVPPYHWLLTSGALPAGLSLSDAGMISGTPTAAGVFNFTIQVLDSATQPTAARAVFSLTIAGLAIVTTSPLRRGVVGGPYFQALAATGGTPPYVWSLAPGSPSLPDGLALSAAGVISGTPTQYSCITLTLQVRDASTATALASLLLSVDNFEGELSRIGVLPQIAAGGGWDTEIWLINNSPLSVPVRLDFHAEDGSPSFKDANWIIRTVPLQVTTQGLTTTVTAATVEAEIAANGALIVATGAVDAPVQGWADVLGTGPLSGFAVFRSSTLGEGTVPLQTQTSPSTLILPFDNTPGLHSEGVALANISSSSTYITATVWDAAGDLLASGVNVDFKASDTTGARRSFWLGSSHDAFMLSDVLPATAGIRGIVQFKAGSGALAGIGLRVDLVRSTIASSPATVQ